MSLQRFLTRLIWLCILPLGVLAAYLATDLIQKAQSKSDREAQYLAKSLASAIDHHLNARLGALDMLAMSPIADQESRWKDLYEEGQSFRQSFGSHVIFSDAQNRMLFNTRMPFGSVLPAMPQTAHHGAAQGNALSGVAEVSNLFKGPSVKDTVLALSVPVLRMGKPKYVVATHIEASQFQFRLDELALPSGWSATLLDGNGDVIVRRGPQRAADNAGESTARQFVAKSLAAPWSVVLEIPRVTYLSPLLEAAVALLVAILAAALAGVIGGRLASRRLGKSLASLTDTPSPGSWPNEIMEIAQVRQLLFSAYEKNADANASRRSSEQRFRAIFEQAAVGISLTSTQGRLLLTNQKLCDITGYSRDELARKTFQEITHPEDLQADRDLT
ncbi:MAG: hypothetical protein RIR45_246, partial [Pseudomonadota bacterium]